ncbi:GTPase-activating protein RGD2 NDAI_0A06650 [Naumovozyma dairenensis CBS 421]|uniref:Rho-GAP domain-containing protein n=1 Tax=Naumovozyma dairenensis (strain ATCC 10597 / BCRC 20456 / CBS 421 / NBRC 0211 / NRRL Y-12639) TaxID=1071378 RepID=G0W4T1_NAUDC|nr:hypothetical protein NDAI_0A06650 [Naumovozyma dairenensis CBS 421]CCD22819.1 hypothetical protein NDAI_0A06650 [Naumovozyma dairenensis CBS 421]
MTSFADSFWSADLLSGLQALFDRLAVGCDSSDHFIQLFASRMQIEVLYGRQLYDVQKGIDNTDYGEDYSTTDEALRKIITGMEQEGDQHLNIASNIQTLVLEPFSKWCSEHRERIKYSENILIDNVKNYQKSKKYVQKLEKVYYNSCKNLESFKRTNFNDEELSKALGHLTLQKELEASLHNEKEHQNFATIDSITFDYKTMREVIKEILVKLPKSEYKLPLINYTLTNTNSGKEITNFLLKHLSLKDLDQAEIFGQELLNIGFIKYCNGVGTTFVNSKKFVYQWKDYAYKFADLSEQNKNNGLELNYLQGLASKLPMVPTVSSSPSNTSTVTKSGPAEANFPLNEKLDISEDEKKLFKLLDEVEKSDKIYHEESFKMDSLRCSIEELMIDHLSFMEKCESDRLKAIKKATIDFCSTLGNKISIIKLHVDAILEASEAIDPAVDLLTLISNYKTGIFKPQAITYNNYYNPGIYQNFGVDLETRCRLDGKVVPLIVSAMLLYMDSIYPDLANDKVRTSIWISPVKLSSTHKLRRLLNEKQFKDEYEIIELFNNGSFEAGTIASALKIYLLELPEPLISSDSLDVLKLLYSKFSTSSLPGDNREKAISNSTNADGASNMSSSAGEENSQMDVGIESKRIMALSTTLSSLGKPYLATLDAITRHFYRLIKILRMGKDGDQIAEDFTKEISKEFASCLLHSSIHDGNDLGYKIFHDLLTYKKQILKNLKRSST